jgi:4'-phosphopantetheinyl transferase
MAITPLLPALDCALWRVDLDAPATAQALACLDRTEQERARRFVFERDRSRYLAAHAALRQTLADRTGHAAAQLVFAPGPHGKPALAGRAAQRFNLSHSQDVGLIALGDGGEIGVDVERLRPFDDAMALAASHFTPMEQAALAAATPGPDRDAAFLRCWTRKEACLKALGIGLGLVDTRSFHAGTGSEPCELVIDFDGARHRLSLVSIDGGEGVVAALARASVAAPQHAETTCEACA